MKKPKSHRRSREKTLGSACILLAIACGESTEEQEVAPRTVPQQIAATAAPAPDAPGETVVSVKLKLPASVPLDQVPIAVRDGVSIADRARVLTSTGRGAAIVNTGTAAIDVGTDALVGSMTSEGAVTLRDRSRVEGNILTASTVSRSSSAWVTGSVREKTPVGTYTEYGWTDVFPAQTQPQDLSLEPGTTREVLPGKYGGASVKSRAKLVLRSGSYHFERLELFEPDSTLELLDDDGPVFLYVKSKFYFRGRAVSRSGQHPKLFVVYLGQEQAQIESAYTGVVVAPNAPVVLARTSTPHRGSFIAQSVQLRADARVEHMAADWRFASGPDLAPVVECVTKRSDSVYTAFFGYHAGAAVAQTVAFGSENRISGEQPDRGQPTTFLPGRSRHSFAVNFNGTDLLWRINGRVARASGQSQPCAESVIAATASRDTRVSAVTPNANYGADAGLQIGPNSHALFDFDLGALRSRVGTGRYVASATLELTLPSGTVPPPERIRVFEITEPWTEPGATWRCAEAPSNDLSACAKQATWDMDPARLVGPWAEPSRATVRVVGNTLHIDVTRDVRDRLSRSTAPRYGWVLQSDTAAVIAAKESSTPPRLNLRLDGSERPDRLTFDVDPSVQAPVPLIPGFSSGSVRSVGAIVDPDGKQAELVESELIVHNNDPAVAQAIASKYGGQVVFTRSSSEHGLAELPSVHVVRINPDRADPRTLAPLVQRLDNRPRGAHRASSAHTLSTLAAAAAEADAGTAVSVNWVARNQDMLDRQIMEDPIDGTGTSTKPGYGRNPFQWPHMRVGGAQDIGVAEAWRALELSGKLRGSTITAAIIDGGFRNDRDDWAPILLDWSPLPFVFSGIGIENVDDNTPWHGSDVLHSGYAMPNNETGAAGPGGPVSELILVHNVLDFVTNIPTVAAVHAQGADTTNMSFYAEVPATLSWSVVPFNEVTRSTWRHGTLNFACAGNDGENVDGEDCVNLLFGDVCWEERWYAPCENSGVVCVGGLEEDSTSRHDFSNYGNEDVDIFGPYIVAVPTQDALDGRPGIDVVGGTSYASPFVAGVAALIWAADPGQSASDVWSTMQRYAHKHSADKRVRSWVNALPAVLSVLDDVPPYVKITTPVEGDTYTTSSPPLVLAAIADDYEDGQLPVEWTSDVDGPIPGGLFVFSTPGARTITARVVDSAGRERTDQVTINVTAADPLIWIKDPRPQADGRIYVFEKLGVGFSSDSRTGLAVTPCGQRTWTSSAGAQALTLISQDSSAGTDPVTGCAVEAYWNSPGTDTITVTATTTDGQVGTDSVEVVVQPLPPGPPIVSFLRPTSRRVESNEPAMFELKAAAADDVGIHEFVWFLDGEEYFRHVVDGHPGSAVSIAPSLRLERCFRSAHVVVTAYEWDEATQGAGRHSGTGTEFYIRCLE